MVFENLGASSVEHIRLSKAYSLHGITDVEKSCTNSMERESTEKSSSKVPELSSTDKVNDDDTAKVENDEITIDDIDLTASGVFGQESVCTAFDDSPAKEDCCSSGCPPLRKGYMLKKGQIVKNWKNRYFVLEAGVLKYYEESTKKYPFGNRLKGEIPLKNMQVVLQQPRIYLNHKDGSNRLELEIPNTLDRVDWCTAIKRHIEYTE